MTTPTACRRALAGGIVAAVAAVHVLRAGTHLDGSLHRLYCSYASNLLLPLAMYFLPCLAGTRLRLLGVPMLGRTFDPVDFVMYGAGVLAAVLLDRLVLSVLGRGSFARSRPTA